MHALPFQLFCQKLMSKHSERMTALAGMFKLCPRLTKYIVTYDRDTILQYIDSLPVNSLYPWILLLKNYALCFFYWLDNVTIRSSLKVDRSVLAHGAYTFYINATKKSTRPGRHHRLLIFQSFEPNEKFCIINCLKEYRSHIDLLRENLEGILSYEYLHKAVNSQTIVRYVKRFLGHAMELTLLYSLHTLLEVPLHQQQITWGCLSRNSKSSRRDWS